MNGLYFYNYDSDKEESSQDSSERDQSEFDSDEGNDYSNCHIVFYKLYLKSVENQ